MRMVRAGAGAGKTTDLVQHILSVVKNFNYENGRLPKLVVTTFTRKATQELKERLFIKALQESDIQTREMLIKYLQSTSSIHISTIHGVLSLFLKKFGYVVGLNPNFSYGSLHADPLMIKKWFKKDIRQNQDEYEEILSEYGIAKFHEVAQKLVPLMLFQVDLEPWSKEDFLSVRRSWWTVQKQDLASLIRQIDEDLQKKDRTEKSEIWYRALDQLNILIQDPKCTEDQLDWIGSCVRSILEPVHNRSRVVSTETSEYKKQVLEAWAQDILKCYSNDFMELHSKKVDQLKRIVSRMASDYLQAKLSQNQINIQDLENLAKLVLNYKPETAKEFSEDFDYWLVDEYQDTSPDQVKLLDALSQGRSQYIVGDPQQSIYLFRGARSKVFFDKANWIIQQQGEVKVKMINYRSSPTVMNFINDLFPKLSSQFLMMEVGTPPDKFQHKINEVVVHSEADDEPDVVVRRIQNLLQMGVRHKDIAVLAFKKSQLKRIAEKCQELGIPHIVHGGGNYLERSEVKDVLLILRFISQPHDDANLVGLLRTPYINWSDDKIVKIAKLKKTDLSYWQVLLKLEQSEIDITALKELIILANKFGYVEGLIRILDYLKVWEVLRSTDISGQKEANIWKLICDLRGQARNAGFQLTEFILNNEIVISDEDDTGDDAAPILESQKVNLMTIHASKGLEFDHVILPFLGDQNIQRSRNADQVLYDEHRAKWAAPIYDQELEKWMKHPCSNFQDEWEKQQRAEEKLRVLYVGMTRAKNSLCLTWGKPASSSLAHSIEQKYPQIQNYFKDSGEKSLELSRGIDQLSSDEVSDDIHFNIYKSDKIGREISVTKLVNEHFQKKSSMSNANNKSIDQKWILDSLEKVVEGVQIHLMFQNLKYEVNLENAISNLSGDVSGVFQNLNVPLREILQNGFVEMSLAFQVSEQLTILGQIDLWGRSKSGSVWVIDYKTGSAKYQAKAIMQLQVYAWMLRKLNLVRSHESLSIAVIYPWESKVIVQAEDVSFVPQNFSLLNS